MKAAKVTFCRRTAAFCPTAALLLIVFLILAAPTAAAQVQVFVPGNTNGCFGNPVDECVPLVSALSVSGPGKINVTYVSGTVTDAGVVNTGPDGVPWTDPRFQIPLQEKLGVWLWRMSHLDGLIGVFVPQSRVQRKGFSAIDGTKGLTRVGIMPDGLFLIGTDKTFPVSEPGTLFLGINDCWVGDNGGGFTVMVTGP